MTRLQQLMILSALTLLSVMWGCKEKDVAFTTDEDEIKSLIAKSEEGRDLFRWENLIVPTDYTVADTTYRDSVISHRRTVEVTLNPHRVYFYSPHGLQTEAVARVIDEFTVKITRAWADTMAVDTADRDMTRWAFLLQLGTEANDYKGWFLWGYNGGSSNVISVNVQPIGLTSFPGDGDIYHQVRASNADFTGDSGYTFSGNSYIRLDSIPKLTDGIKLAVSTQDITSGGTSKPMPRISAAGASGFFTRTMTPIDRSHYVDTIQTPTNNPRIWNIVYLETRRDLEPVFFIGAHVFAYRIPAQ